MPEVVVSIVGSIDIRTDSQQANGSLLAQQSEAVRADVGGYSRGATLPDLTFFNATQEVTR
jgi:hypothetical protein